MAYDGSITLISGITQANNGDFALVDATAVYIDDDTRLPAELDKKAPKTNPTFTGGMTLGGYEANSEYSAALGDMTTASGENSMAQGYVTQAEGFASHSEGGGTIARGDESHSEGIDTYAQGRAAHSEGQGTYANFLAQHVFGQYNENDPSEGVAEYYQRGTYIEMVGNGTSSTYGNRSNARALDWAGNERLKGNVYVQCNADSSGGKKLATEEYVDTQSMAMTYKGVVNSNSDLPAVHEKGWMYKVGANGTYAGVECSIGDTIICKNTGSVASNADWDVVQTSDASVVIGPGSSSSNSNKIVLFDGESGNLLKASTYTVGSAAAKDVDIDFTTPTSSNLPTTAAVSAQLNLKASIANPTFTGNVSLGRKENTTVGTASSAFGYRVEASGNYSHAEGQSSKASAPSSHAEGYTTKATGENSHAEGSETTASGSASHAEGVNATASGSTSHAEGNNSTASGNGSHAEGSGTTASGIFSHAEGYNTQAKENSAHAEGYGTIANASYSHVVGKHNIPDSYDNWPEWAENTHYYAGDKVTRTTAGGSVIGYICKEENTDASFTSSKWETHYAQMNYVEIVGNGENTNSRSNARVLDWEGNERLMGDLYVGCNVDSTGGTKVATIDNPTFAGSITIGNTTITEAQLIKVLALINSIEITQ